MRPCHAVRAAGYYFVCRRLRQWEAQRGLYWQVTCTRRSLSPPFGQTTALSFKDSRSDEMNRDACLSARHEKRIRTATPSCVRSLYRKGSFRVRARLTPRRFRVSGHRESLNLHCFQNHESTGSPMLSVERFYHLATRRRKAGVGLAH